MKFSKYIIYYLSVAVFVFCAGLFVNHWQAAARIATRFDFAEYSSDTSAVYEIIRHENNIDIHVSRRIYFADLKNYPNIAQISDPKQNFFKDAPEMAIKSALRQSTAFTPRRRFLKRDGVSLKHGVLALSGIEYYEAYLEYRNVEGELICKVKYPYFFNGFEPTILQKESPQN